MKRPNEKEFWEKWDYYKGDSTALSEIWDCSIPSVYNWFHYFEELKEQQIDEAVDDEVFSDVEDKVEHSFDYYVEKQKESPNKPEVRETTIGVRESCLVIMLADTHFGSKYVNVDMANNIKNACARNKNVYAFFDGDLIDYQGSGPPDIKYDQTFAHPNTVRAMAESYIKEFNGSMLLLLTGCHSNWTYRWTGETFEERLVKHLPTKGVFPDSVIVNFKVGDQMYRGHVAHKAGKGNSRYNPSHGGFQEAREDLDVDFIVSAHNHNAGIAMQYIRQNEVLVVNCGTCKLIGNFANKTYNQKPLSMPAVYFDAENKRMIPFFHWEDGVNYVKKLNEDKDQEESLDTWNDSTRN